MLRDLGATVVGLSLIPEPILARELGIAYAAVAGITNVLHGQATEFDETQLLRVMRTLIAKQRNLFLQIVDHLFTDKATNERVVLSAAVNQEALIEFWHTMGLRFGE